MPRDAYSETQRLIKGKGYIPREFRPSEEVEEERKAQGPRKYVAMEEIPASDSNPLENLIKKEEGGWHR